MATATATEPKRGPGRPRLFHPRNEDSQVKQHQESVAMAPPPTDEEIHSATARIVALTGVDNQLARVMAVSNICKPLRWTVLQIAERAGVSDRTVYNYQSTLEWDDAQVKLAAGMIRHKAREVAQSVLDSALERQLYEAQRDIARTLGILKPEGQAPTVAIQLNIGAGISASYADILAPLASQASPVSPGSHPGFEAVAVQPIAVEPTEPEPTSE